MGAMQRRKEFFNYEQFYETISDHKWSFLMPRDAASFYNYIQKLDVERDLFQQAMRGGPEAVEYYYVTQRRALSNEQHIVIEQAVKNAREIYEKMIATGDSEFDEFRKKVYYFDWFYEYTDDGDVWRNANNRLKEIEATIQQHADEPKYRIYYDYIRNQVFGSSKEKVSD